MKLSALVAAIIAVLACTAQSAFAHQFIRSPEKSGFHGKGGTQIITLGSHAVTCKSATIDGHAVSEFLEMEVNHSSCEAFSKTATVSEAAFKDTANGTGGVIGDAEKMTMTITVKPTTESECVYKLPTSSSPVSSVSFKDNVNGITIKSALNGLTYELKETGTSVCGTNGEKASTGKYEGEVTTEPYVGEECVFWTGGAYGWPNCVEFYNGVMEKVISYKALEWL